MKPIQVIGVALSHFPPLRRLFLFGYWLVFQGVRLVFLGHAGVILRRPQVFRDGIPGLSDLDLTLVVPEGAKASQWTAIALRLQRIRKWVPILGETWLIPQALGNSHFTLQALDYGEQSKADRHWNASLALRRRWDLELFRRGRVQNRLTAQRLAQKAGWLESGLQHGVWPALVYQTGVSPKLRNRADWGKGPASDSDLRIRLAGRPFFPLEDLRQELVLRVGERVAQETRTDVRLVCYRPYLFRNTLQIRVEEGFSPSEGLQQDLRKLFAESHFSGLGLTPSYPVLWSAIDWSYYEQANPFFNLTGPRTVSSAVFSLEILEHLTMLYSALRGNETNFYLDCLLSLAALKRVQQGESFPADVREMLFLACRELGLALPQPIENLYLAGDLVGLDKTDLKSLWETLYPELKKLTRWSQAVLPQSEAGSSRAQKKIRNLTIASSPTG